MTVQNRESFGGDQWVGEDEIDLRQYVDTLVNWWREILLIMVLSALLAGGGVYLLGQLQEDSYAATATVVIARISSDVNFDDRFLTTSEEGAAATVATSRRTALLGLVKNGAIAQAVIDELGAQWPIEERAPSNLLEHVEAALASGSDPRTPGDLIQITVTANAPDKAADIANIWSQYYVDNVNSIYGQVPEALVASVQSEQSQTEQRYRDAQEVLESYIETSQVESLTRQLETDRALLATLKQGQIDAASAVINRDVNARLELFNSLVDAEVNPSLALVQQQTNQNVQRVSDLMAIRSQLQQALGQAQALQRQVTSGGEAATATNALALQLLKAQVYASTSPASTQELPNSRLQIDIDAALPATVAEQQADIAALITSLEEYLASIGEEIDRLGQEVLANDSYQFVEDLTTRGFSLGSMFPTAAPGEINEPDVAPAVEDETDEVGQMENPLSQAIAASYTSLFGLGALSNQAQATSATLSDLGDVNGELGRAIAQLEQRIQRLSAELEGEQAMQRQLSQQRDLAWTAYETLNNKVVELNLARSAANSEVRFGSPAIAPVKPVPETSFIMATMLGGVMGFIFGVFLALFATYLGKEPFLRRTRPRAA